MTNRLILDMIRRLNPYQAAAWLLLKLIETCDDAEGVSHLRHALTILRQS